MPTKQTESAPSFLQVYTQVRRAPEALVPSTDQRLR